MVEQEGMDRVDRLAVELQQEIDAKGRALYSARVLEQARNPTNLGRMEDPDVHAILTGWCGDTMEIYVRLNGDTIREAMFMTDGCGPSVACGSMLTTMVRGLALDEAEEIDPQDLLLALDGLPEESTHCAQLAVETLRKALVERE
jgi:nitrogen fixation NifU-like protein